MKLISVIVPVYKVEQYLEKCLDSIINQTYRNIEIILVDDGSPDRCGQICDEYSRKDERIKVIHKENGGLSDARNVGTKQASGEYLLFIDSDDYVEHNLVEKVAEVINKRDCDMVLFDYIKEEEDGSSEECYSNLPENQMITLESNPEIIISTLSAWSKLYRKEFYLKAGHWFPVGRYYEDLGSIPKLYLDAKNIVYIREALYHYNIRQGSIMTSTKYDKNYNDRTAMFNDIIRYYKEQGKYEQYHAELEYLAFGAVYFEPSKEIILADWKNSYIRKFREYYKGLFPEFKKNPYMNRLTGKDRIHLKILDVRQYWMMVLLSYARRFVSKCKRR